MGRQLLIIAVSIFQNVLRQNIVNSLREQSTEPP